MSGKASSVKKLPNQLCESVKAGSLWQPLVGCAERGTTFITVYAVLFCIFIAQADFPMRIHLSFLVQTQSLQTLTPIHPCSHSPESLLGSWVCWSQPSYFWLKVEYNHCAIAPLKPKSYLSASCLQQLPDFTTVEVFSIFRNTVSRWQLFFFFIGGLLDCDYHFMDQHFRLTGRTIKVLLFGEGHNPLRVL